jgi:DNA sulfur modification protein DndC
MQSLTNPGSVRVPVDEHVKETRDSLRRHYFADQRAWVVAYSGGKDSTLVLQLVYDLILELGSSAKKPIFIVASDTRVEAPNVEEYLADRLSRVASHARANGLPVYVHRVQPTPEQSFWGNLIGKGYPSPTRWFRWCTTKMKTLCSNSTGKRAAASARWSLT